MLCMQPPGLNALLEINSVIPPGHRFSEMINQCWFHTQCLTYIADGATTAVGNHRRGKRGTLAAVFIVNVLDNFFTALVLEINIDIRWLIALFGNKALKQNIDLTWRYFGNKQAIADHRIGCRAAPLTENILCPCKFDNVMHGEKKIFVIQLLNYR